MVGIAENQRGGSLPWENSESRKIGAQFKIAESLFPTGQLEAIHWVHFHIDGEQVIARVSASLGDGFREELSGKTFADQPPEHIRENNQDIVYFFRRDFLPKSLEIHKSKRSVSDVDI